MSARALVVVVALLAALHAATFLGSGPHDDDFILYRYAANWVAGEGLVFNPGERVEGFSAPLWVFWIGAGLRLGLDPVVVSLTTSIVACGVAAWAVGEAWRARFPVERVPAAAVIVAASPALAWHGVVGMGTTTLAALLAGWYLAHERACSRGRPAWLAAALLALACLLRQECALFALPFFAVELRRGRPAAACLPLAALAGWTAFRFGYFGRWLPVTYEVKKLPALVDLGYGLRYLLRASWESGVGLWIVGAFLAWRRTGADDVRRPALAAAALGLGAHTAYVVWVGGDYLQLSRFFVPTLPLMMLLGCVGLRPRQGRRADALMTAIVVLGLQSSQLQRPQLFGEHRFFVDRWEQLGRHFGRVVTPDTKVAISPIGAFGYYSRLPIVDILGLTNTALVARPPDLAIEVKGHHRSSGAWVLDQRPELLILGNGVRQPDGQLVINPWERSILEEERFGRDYQWRSVSVAGGSPVDVCRLRGSPDPPGSSVLSR